MKRILVIDDEASMRALIETFLKNEGYEVVLAEDGRKGIRKFKQEPFKVVITDMFMPEIDGIEVIMELKKIAPETKIIAISGGCKLMKIPLERVLNDSILLGANYIFAKPFDLDVLLKAIEKSLDNN